MHNLYAKFANFSTFDVPFHHLLGVMNDQFGVDFSTLLTNIK